MVQDVIINLLTFFLSISQRTAATTHCCPQVSRMWQTPRHRLVYLTLSQCRSNHRRLWHCHLLCPCRSVREEFTCQNCLPIQKLLFFSYQNACISSTDSWAFTSTTVAGAIAAADATGCAKSSQAKRDVLSQPSDSAICYFVTYLRIL